MTRVILHALGSLNRGGAETVALDLVRYLPRGDPQQVFVCLSGDKGSLAPEFEAAGASVIALRGGIVRKAIDYVQILRRTRPDVVQAHVSLSSGWLLLVARTLRVRRRIARIHSQGDGRDDHAYRRVYRRLCRLALIQGATTVLAVSEAARDFAINGHSKQLGARTRVLHNGVDLDRFRYTGRTASKTITVIHVGRNDAAKNRASLAPIAQQLMLARRTEFLVVGGTDDTDLGDYRGLLTVLGPRNDVSQLLQKSDVLLLPSIREGLPGVVLEALASGVPVVASDIDTLRDLRSKVTGLELVSLEDAPSVWASKINQVATLTTEDRASISAGIQQSSFALSLNAQEWLNEWGHIRMTSYGRRA